MAAEFCSQWDGFERDIKAADFHLWTNTITGMQQGGRPGGRGPPRFWQIRRRRRAAAARRITTGPPGFLTLVASLGWRATTNYVRNYLVLKYFHHFLRNKLFPPDKYLFDNVLQLQKLVTLYYHTKHCLQKYRSLHSAGYERPLPSICARKLPFQWMT